MVPFTLVSVEMLKLKLIENPNPDAHQWLAYKREIAPVLYVVFFFLHTNGVVNASLRLVNFEFQFDIVVDPSHGNDMMLGWSSVSCQ